MSIYDNIRPSDLRHEHPHALAEMVQDLQDLADTITSAQTDSKKLLSGALLASKEGAVHLKEASLNLRATTEQAQRVFSETIEHKSEELILTLNEAINVIRKDTAILIQRSNQTMLETTAKLTNVASQLALVAAEADAKRATVIETRLKLTDYRRNLDVHQAIVQKQCKEAVAKATAGLSFLERLWAVFMPPKITVNIPKAPANPKP